MAISWNENYNGTTTFSDVCVQINCAAGAEETYTVPGSPLQQFQALFGYPSNSNVFVRLNAVPTVPISGGVNSESFSEMRPDKRYVKGGDVLHFITPDTNAYIGLSLRQIQG